jgi:hypothetical protein
MTTSELVQTLKILKPGRGVSVVLLPGSHPWAGGLEAGDRTTIGVLKAVGIAAAVSSESERCYDCRKR